MDDKTDQKSNGISDSSTRFLSLETNNSSTTNMHDDADDENDDQSHQLAELNNRIKNDFISYCLSFLQEDEEARECVQVVWNKYLQCVGDVAMISAFFDTLPYSIKASVLQKYQNEIIEWCRSIFHINCDTLLYSTLYSETLLRIIRYALKQIHNQNELSTKKAVIYVSSDFDTNLKHDLLSSISNIRFEHIQNDSSREDMIGIVQLEQIIKRDVSDDNAYPFMIIANAGSAIFGRCDELTKMRQLCHQYNIWLHALGDLLGSLAMLSTIKENVHISCDSLTIDTIKLLGIQNLPYLTFIMRTKVDLKQDKHVEFSFSRDEQPSIDNLSTKSTTNSSTASSSTAIANANHILLNHPFYEAMLQSPSISFLSIWSISQRCSKTHVIYHLKHSFDLSNLLMKNLKQSKTFKILNDDDNYGMFTYKRICSGDLPDDPLPKTVVIFRFEADDVPQIETLDGLYSYINLLNLWLFDKLSQQYPKLNLELLKNTSFQVLKSEAAATHQLQGHAIRFAPLEHLLDVVDDHDIQMFTDDLLRYSDILLATLSARVRLSSSVAKYTNLVSITMPNWAGIGAVRYIPSHINMNEESETSSYDINAIQAELSRKLQANDSAFSLGGGVDEDDSLFYLRLGMIRKCDDLDVLLQKIAENGKETEQALKYAEDMAEKIKAGIEKAQQDLQNENQQILAQEGLLRQLPVISNIMSWWSSSPTISPLAIKGRSFDLNSGRVESTEETYAYRMQIKKQSPHSPTHNDTDTVKSSADTELTENSTDTIPEQEHN